jgi:hypothetical protein
VRVTNTEHARTTDDGYRTEVCVCRFVSICNGTEDTMHHFFLRNDAMHHCMRTRITCCLVICGDKTASKTAMSSG